MKKYLSTFLTVLLLLGGFVTGITLMSNSDLHATSPLGITAVDQTPLMPTVSRVVSTSALSYITIEDTASAYTTRRALVVQKKNVRIQTFGSGSGAKFAIVEVGSGRVICFKPFTGTRIAPQGYAQTDSLKRNLLMGVTYATSP